MRRGRFKIIPQKDNFFVISGYSEMVSHMFWEHILTVRIGLP